MLSVSCVAPNSLWHHFNLKLLSLFSSGQEASARGGGVRRRSGRGSCHQCGHHRGRSLCFSLFLYSRVEGGAYQRANRLQAPPQTGYTANLIWKFTVLIKIISFVSEVRIICISSLNFWVSQSLLNKVKTVFAILQ